MKKNKKVLLATPPFHTGVVESAGIWPPLGLIHIAGELLKEGYEVEIYDSMSRQDTMDDVRKYLKKTSYDVIGIGPITAGIVSTLEVFRISKDVKPKAVTVLGNVHATFQYQELLQKHSQVIDYIVKGEGEITMCRLMDALCGEGAISEVKGLAYKENGKIQVTPGRSFVSDLDLLSPAWHLLDWNLYKFFVLPHSRLGIINSSRGCPHECSFCSQQKFWQRSYREVSPRRFVDQLKYLRKTGVNVVMLSDEYPTKNRDRWNQILDIMIAEEVDMYLLLETRAEDILRDRDILWKYRKAGVIHIYVGVEATNQASLDIFKKDIKCEEGKESLRLIAANGIISECSFVLGMPDETPETIASTLELAKHYNPDFAHFLAITPWPYADLYESTKDRIEVWDYSKYDLVTPIIRPYLMTLAEVNSAIIQCYKNYYMWKVPSFSHESDDFRREYLQQGMRVMMKNSFLTKYMTGSDMPPEVEQYLTAKKGCPYTWFKKAVGFES